MPIISKGDKRMNTVPKEVNQFLQEKNIDGILYSYNIAIRMQNEAIKSGFSLNEAQDMFILGLLHDIGKYYATNGENIYKLREES